MTGEQILNNRRAWQIMSAQYDGIEKWQRQVVYERAIEAGMSHGDALAEAHGRAKGTLPDVVFQADEQVGPAPKLWETGLLGLQGE